MIRIENLHKRLGNQWVLRGVDLQVERGQVVTLVGPSGTGKSVLLKHIVGLLAPDAGDVYVGAQRVGRATNRELAELRRRIGYVFQDGALLDSLSIRENLLYAVDDDTRERAPRAAERRIGEVLATVNLDARVLEKLPSQISGGTRKRVAVARALLNAPELVLYDEPTAGLDPQNVAAIADIVRHTRERSGATSLIITHDLGFLEAVADRVVMLHEGRIRFDGSPREFFTTQDRLVTEFLGRGHRLFSEAA